MTDRLRIDSEHYRQGRAAFVQGESLLSVVARCAGDDKSAEEEDRDLSFVVGFADALLDRLRGVQIQGPGA